MAVQAGLPPSSEMLLQLKKLDQRRARLGMSKSAVAQRARVSLPTVNRILSGKDRVPTVQNLHAIAKALGVIVHLGEFVEIEEPLSADEYRQRHARQKAAALMRMVQGTMALEDQAVDQAALERMIDRTTHELLRSKRRLWGE